MLKRARLLAKLLAGLLSLAVLAALGVLAESGRRAALSDSQHRAGLIARTLENHVTRTVESASLILQTLGEGTAQQSAVEPQRLQQLLAQPLFNSLPFLRGAAVLDESGHVLASSVAGEQGIRVDLSKLGPLPRDGQDALLPLLPGRGLTDLVAGAKTARATDVRMLPLLRAVRGASGRRLLLLALINPDALANFQQVALADEGGVALLSSWDGRLVAASDQLALKPGARISQHPVFDGLLAAREHGEYLGAGIHSGRQLVAYRASRSRPLVIVVELSEQVALKTWRTQVGWLCIVGLMALLAISVGLTALLHEMNAREKARHALDEAHEQVALREHELSVLLKSVQELIFRTDTQGAITFVNARWAAISHQGTDQAKGQSFVDLVAPADRERTQALFRLDDRSGVRQAQVCLIAADGNPRHFFVAIVPLHSKGRIVGFAGSALDVSERVMSDQQLKHQSTFTGLLLELSPLPVSMFDATGRYVMVNQAWEELVGRKRADVVGSPVGGFLSSQDAALHSAQDAQLLNCGGKLRYETQLKHRDGSCRDMVVTKVLVPGEHGTPAGILCTLMDVSEFRDAERATREARDAAEEASRSKSEFVANISHELRTPLQAILGYSELGFTRGQATPKLAGMFTDIHNSGQRMLALVNDLLDVSKIESTVGTFHLERYDVRTLVQSVLRELHPLLGQRALRLQLHMADEPLISKVDPTRIHQAIRNVVANAIKFSPEGGELRIDCVATPQDELMISVADQGPGIPTAELEAVFEPFVQSSKTKDGSGGTGLGLAICRKILAVHGGRIVAQNRGAGGTVFRIHLPLRVSGDSQMHTTY